MTLGFLALGLLALWSVGYSVGSGAHLAYFSWGSREQVLCREPARKSFGLNSQKNERQPECPLITGCFHK